MSRHLLSLAVLVLLPACAATETAIVGPSSANLEATSRLQRSIGDTYRYIQRHENDAILEIEVTGFEDNGDTIISMSTGSIVKSSDFLSTVAYDGKFGKGTRTYTGDSLFPLETGRSLSVTIEERHEDSEPIEFTRDCTILEQVVVEVPAGQFDTIHIVCEHALKGRTTQTRNHYYAPEIREQVLYVQQYRDGTVKRFELEGYELVEG